MEALLGAQDAWEFVTTEYEEPTDAEIGATTANQLKALKEKCMKAKTALYLLFQSVDESGFEKIAGASTAKQVWDTLEKAYKGADRVKQVRLRTLRGKLKAMRMKETKGVSDYITQNFENVVCVIEESKDLEDLTIEELAGSMEAHEKRKNKKKGRGCRRGGQGYRLNVDCYNCGKHGHYAKDCRSPKRTKEKNHLVTEPQVEESGILLMAHEEQILEVDTMWYLDSGASNHMSGQKDLFVEMIVVVQGYVSFGDASKIDVKGRGKIHFFQNGKEGTIKDVYYVPAMKSNILSLGQLMEKGYWVLMKNEKMLLKNKEGVMVTLVRMCKNRTFKLNLNSIAEKCLKSDLSDEESMWHLRFGHLHFSGLKELTRKSMAHGLPNLEYDGRFCESYIFGKQTRSSFPQKSTYEAKGLLELIHSDLCGPFSPVSFGNKSTEQDAHDVFIPTALSDPTMVTTDSENNDEPIQPRMRSLQDIYNNTTKMHLVCRLAKNENIIFEEAIRNKKWKEAMDEEISAIEKNKTWEMAKLPKGHKPIGVK
ncbi:retrovirus-related pol polyprotein from transposon TNT 1-94 [Tanacetum coccineum]